MKKLIVIADWAADPVYCNEYISAVNGFSKETSPVNIYFIPATLSSIHAGFILAQTVLTEERLGRAQSTIFHMACEPAAIGLNFLIIRLVSGSYIAGFNYDYVYSFVKNSIDKVFSYSIKSDGSNFVSRDIFSRTIVHLLESRQDELELEETHTNTLSQLSGYYVGHIDSFGNIATTIKHEVVSSKYQEGNKVGITIGSTQKKAIYRRELWKGGDDEIVAGPSSFGSLDNPYIAIVKKRRNSSDQPAVSLFGTVCPGDEITIK